MNANGHGLDAPQRDAAALAWQSTSVSREGVSGEARARGVLQVGASGNSPGAEAGIWSGAVSRSTGPGASGAGGAWETSGRPGETPDRKVGLESAMQG